MAKLYSNENFPLPVVESLRNLGHDVLTVREAGKAELSISDEEVLEFAVNSGRILLTLNRRHFIRLHSVRPNHSGIIVCTFDTDFSGQAERIHAELEAKPQFGGLLVRVNRTR